MSKMHPHKQAVIAALANGPYIQIKGQLREGQCFCAEGVVADVAVKLGFTRWEKFYGEMVLEVGPIFAEQYPEEIPGFNVTERDLYVPEDLLVKMFPRTKELLTFLDRHDNDESLIALWGINDVCSLTFSEISELLAAKWGGE